MAFVSQDKSLHRSATSTQLMKPGIDQNLSCTVVAQACLWFTDCSYMFVCIALSLPIISLASCLRLKMGEQKNVPLKDRQMALALILELALQRGTLQQILEAVLLLLRLSGSTCRYYHSNQMQLKCEGEETLKKPPEYGKGPQECGNLPPSNEDQRCYPLIPFLRRIGDIPTPETPYVGFQRVDTVSACLCVLVSLTVVHFYS